MIDAENQMLYIRADTSIQMGTGHLMRCLALAQGWQSSGGAATFITCTNRVLRERLHEAGFTTYCLDAIHPDPLDLPETVRLASAHPKAWFVLDGYHFDAAYQSALRESGHPLFVIDDTAHHPSYCADALCNQNITAEQLHYNCIGEPHQLLGTRYALLRQDFLAWRTWQRPMPRQARRLLVTLGGSDPDNQTAKVVAAVAQILNDPALSEALETVIVVGGSNPHRAHLQEQVAHIDGNITIRHHVVDMPKLMAWADVAIAAGGSTCWELAFMGVPALLLVLAANQQGIAAGLDRAGVAHNLGWSAQVTPGQIAEGLHALLQNTNRRHHMSQQGRQLVDGLGVQRVVEFLQQGRDPGNYSGVSCQ